MVKFTHARKLIEFAEFSTNKKKDTAKIPPRHLWKSDGAEVFRTVRRADGKFFIATLTQKMSETTEHIKRPMNAFMVWSRNERRKLALKYPNMLNCEISKLLGAEWSRLSEEEKKPYVMEAKRLRTVHSQKYPDYSYKPRRRKNKATKNREVYTSFSVPAPGESLAPPGYGLPMATAPPPPMHYLSPVPTYTEPYLMPMISAPTVSTPKRPYLPSSFSIPSQPETKDTFHHSHLPIAAILPSTNSGYQAAGAERGDSSAVYSMQTSYYKSLFAQRCAPNGPFQPR